MKLAVFDIDGTLADTATESDAAFLEAVAEVVDGGPISPSWADHGDATDSGIADALLRAHFGQAPAMAQLQALQQRYLKRLVRRLTTGRQIQGAAGFLAAMRASHDWTVAVATGNWHAAAVHKLQVSGLPHQGIPMATANDSLRRRDILRRAIELAGPVDRVVYVGDRDWDLRAADDVGVGFVEIGTSVRHAKVSFPDFGCPEAVRAALETTAR